ncbi:MAG: histidinol dehydrogenase [Chloroflexi bacterium]|nr:histidinol dehydrogenase [Chloroflexota bacterium]
MGTSSRGRPGWSRRSSIHGDYPWRVTTRIRDLVAFAREVKKRRVAFDGALLASVRATLADVAKRGDAAVLASVKRFDRPSASAGDLWATPRDLRRAASACSSALREAIDVAYEAIWAFHAKQAPKPVVHTTRAMSTALVPQPLRRVGACVPRGVRGYPSTALMVGIPARIAGVAELVLVSPMPKDGAIDPALAYAALKVEADGLYRAGGAAGVAALAYGTKRLEPVDKIVGPGNAHTTAAKWLVSAMVGIDGLQGPSELVIVASGDADPAGVVLDLEAQAEHGGGPYAALISDSNALLAVVAVVVAQLGANRDDIGLFRAPSLSAGLAAAILFAPEHLNLAGAKAARLAPKARNAGAVFVGSRTAVAFGDYVAGSNHVLPTGGSARWASPLRVEDFVRWTTRVQARGALGRLAAAGAAVARYEDMAFHAASMELRG